MSGMINILNRIERNRWVSIYQDGSDSFMYGRILAFNETDTAVLLVSRRGGFDGIMVVRTDSITKIEYGGMYEQRMSRLLKEDELAEYAVTLSDENICEQVLGLSAKARSVVSLELCDSGYDDITGVVESVEDGIVCVQVIDVYGCPDGKALALLDDITQISYLGEKEAAITELME